MESATQAQRKEASKQSTQQKNRKQLNVSVRNVI